jgi:16S rRNA (guanine1207-N2)-methyltransferase
MAPPDHYFSASPGGAMVPRTISVQLAGRRLDVTTSNGIFSPERVDAGTQVLLGNVPAPPPGGAGGDRSLSHSRWNPRTPPYGPST